MFPRKSQTLQHTLPVPLPQVLLSNYRERLDSAHAIVEEARRALREAEESLRASPSGISAIAAAVASATAGGAAGGAGGHGSGRGRGGGGGRGAAAGRAHELDSGGLDWGLGV